MRIGIRDVMGILAGWRRAMSASAARVPTAAHDVSLLHFCESLMAALTLAIETIEAIDRLPSRRLYDFSGRPQNVVDHSHLQRHIASFARSVRLRPLGPAEAAPTTEAASGDSMPVEVVIEYRFADAETGAYGAPATHPAALAWHEIARRAVAQDTTPVEVRIRPRSIDDDPALFTR